MFEFFSVLLLVSVALAQTPKSITVLTPASGDSLKGGFLSNVTWSSTGLAGDELIGVEVWDARQWLMFDLFKIDRDDNLLASYTTKNTGVFSFFAPVLSKNDDSFFIVVFSFANRQVYGKSAQFGVVVVSQTLSVTGPTAAAASLRTGEPIKITWSSANIPAEASMRILLQRLKTGFVASIKAWLSDADTVDSVVVVDEVRNTGSFDWIVPLSVRPGEQYLFQVIW